VYAADNNMSKKYTSYILGGASQASTVDIADVEGKFICRFEFLINSFGHIQKYAY
jgi:hypothetical protein